MLEDIEDKMTTQMETQIVAMEEKMENMHKFIWKRNEPIFEDEEEDAEDLGDDDEIDNY